MKRRRVVEPYDDLEVLDPATGEALVVDAPPSATRAGDVGAWASRRRRLRRVRLVFVVLSFTAIGLAAYTTWSITTLRQVERTWRTAMAVDDVRSAVDETIFEELEAFDPDDDTIDSFLTGVGVAASGEFAKAEGALADLDIRDRRTDELRGAMVEALEFRQRQMSPQRRQLGDTPLLGIERQLAAELRRWRLAPAVVPLPRLTAGKDTIDRLRRFTDEPTSTILVALGKDGFSLDTIDIDASSVTRRTMPVAADRLLAVAPDVIVAIGSNGLRAYALGSPPSSGPIWERPGATAFAAPGDEALWIHEGADAVRLDPRGRAIGGPFPVPSGKKPVGATRNGLVLMDDPPTGHDDVILWSPESDRQKPLGGRVRRFIGAGHGVVIVERQFVVEGDEGGPRRELDFVEVVADTGRVIEVIELPVPLLSVVQRPGGIEIAASGGPLAGRLARVFRFTIPGAFPTGGPNVSIEPGALAWSPSGNSLFWVTPDGRLAMLDPARRRVGLVRSPNLSELRTIVAFETQR